jgi:hypothetical protein
MEGVDTTDEALRALREIRQALELAPNDPKVQEIATEISYDFPEGMKPDGDTFDYPWLTATPLPPTPMVETVISTETPLPQATFTPSPQAPSPTPVGGPQPDNSRSTLPFCGGALMIPIGLVFLAQRRFYFARKTRS